MPSSTTKVISKGPWQSSVSWGIETCSSSSSSLLTSAIKTIWLSRHSIPTKRRRCIVFGTDARATRERVFLQTDFSRNYRKSIARGVIKSLLFSSHTHATAHAFIIDDFSIVAWITTCRSIDEVKISIIIHIVTKSNRCVRFDWRPEQRNHLYFYHYCHCYFYCYYHHWYYCFM